MNGRQAKMQTKTNDKRAFWKRNLQEYRKSGLSRKEFSARNGFNKSTLDYWFARISKEKRAQGMVEVKLSSNPTANPTLQIVVAGKYRIEAHRGFDRNLLCEMVKALESLR